MTDRFTDDAIPPFGAPQGLLAWIELPSGPMFLTNEFLWSDPKDAIRTRTFNLMMRQLKVGPQHGDRLTYFCSFVSAFYEHRYPVKRLIREGNDERDNFGVTGKLY